MVKTALFVFGSLLCIAAVLFFFVGNNPKNAIKDEKILVILRTIGHEILLKSKDSTSRILPIEKTASNSFLIRFENPLSISNKELAKIVEQNVQKYSLPNSYLVEVVEEKSNNVFYSYEYNRKSSNEVACLTRDAHKGHYCIKIHFNDNVTSSLAVNSVLPYLILPIAITLLLAGFKSFDVKRNGNPEITEPRMVTEVKVGNFSFSKKGKSLKYGNSEIELSTKEAQILSLLADHPHEILEREMLMKEVWENEGVIVGRSLDVFISKLRKKLSADPSIKIVNIHGKGYRLEVASPNE